MSNPIYHAKSSARKFGGEASDYITIHDFFDQSKACWADHRHRAILHNTFGIFLVEKLIGQAERIKELEKALLLTTDDDHPKPHPLALGGIPVPTYFTRPSDGRVVPIRAIGEQHVEEDLGRIPTLEEWLGPLPRQGWHGRQAQRLSREEENGTK